MTRAQGAPPFVEQLMSPESLRKTVTFDDDGQAAFDPARELADYRRRAYEAWPYIEVTDVDSTGLPDTPVLGSKLTLTATVELAGLRPDEVTVQAGDDGIRFLLVSGKPLEEPVAWYGPIVMNTQDELRRAIAELNDGTFIKHH